MVDWNKIFENLFIKRSGEHAIVGGPTGTGKTQVLYHIAAGITTLHPKESIIWFDIGKSGEPLRLADFRKLHFIVPNGCRVIFKWKAGMQEKYESRIDVSNYQDGAYQKMIKLFRRDSINIVEIKPFIMEPDDYAKRVSAFFKALIIMAVKHRLDHITPTAIFVDEMHWVAPGQGHALNEEHNTAGKWMQLNIDTLRSMGIRIIGATQNWTKIRRGVRQAFSWIFIKRGLAFSVADEWRLSKYSGTFERLATDETIMVLPQRNYSDKMHFPFYGDGRSIGEIYYINDYETEEPQEDMAFA